MNKHLIKIGQMAGALMALAAVFGGLSGWGKTAYDYFLKQPDIVPLQQRVIGGEYDRVFEQRTRFEYLEKSTDGGLNADDYKKLQKLIKKEVELEAELEEVKSKFK